MTNGYSKEDLIIVNIPTADQVSVLVSSASLIGDQQQDAMRKSSISEGAVRKVSTSSVEKKVSFDRGVSIQEEDDQKVEIVEPTTSTAAETASVEVSNGEGSSS